MRMRSLSIVLLSVAFLFSAWSNVIAAAFCSRYMVTDDCRVQPAPSPAKPAGHRSSCGHDMGDMQMDQMASVQPEKSSTAGPEITNESSANQPVLELPVEGCSHCWTHSQQVSGAAIAVGHDQSRRVVVTDTPVAKATVQAPFVLRFSHNTFEHGPPGDVIPRHLLINVFRI